MDTSLTAICAVAFATVLTLLSSLALVIHGMVRLASRGGASQAAASTDAATVAAIQTAVTTATPGARVVRIKPRP